VSCILIEVFVCAPIGWVTVRDQGYLLATTSGADRTYRLSRVLAAERRGLVGRFGPLRSADHGISVEIGHDVIDGLIDGQVG
jgi:hypothetical protein